METPKASVSSLDSDMRRLRMDRYTPQAADEMRAWIEKTLGERLPSGDLLDVLRDGVALCRLANLVLPPPGIKYKTSAMPFTQRENISHFLTACEMPPLNLPAHDRFLTVDLYDGKDPAQVLQCLGAFSRAANAASPHKVTSAVGPKRVPSPTRKHLDQSTPESVSSANSRARGSTLESQQSGSAFTPRTPTAGTVSPSRTGGFSPSSGVKSTVGTVSSWSKRADEGVTAPAWNIHQYGYMGGASQGNQGVSFGARRQIIPTSVDLPPSAVEKERRRREREAEDLAMEEEVERKRQEERRVQEEREKQAEEERWAEETRKARDRERQQVEEEKRRWAEQERKWQEDEERRQKEESNAEKDGGNPALRGQYLSQYQTDRRERSRSPIPEAKRQVSESDRIKDLERQLEEARKREEQYQRERSHGTPPQREKTPEAKDTPSIYRQPEEASSPVEAMSEISDKPRDSWSQADERDDLRKHWADSEIQEPRTPSAHTSTPRIPKDTPASSKATPPRPFPKSDTMRSSPFARPPPKTFTPTRPTQGLAAPQAEPQPLPPPSATAEPPVSDLPPRSPSPIKSSRPLPDPKKYGKSIIEKEMERERERQKEWEEAQMKRDAQGGRGLMGPRQMAR